MLMWVIYSLSTLLIAYLISKYFARKSKLPVVFLVLIVLMTPTNIEVGSNQLAPCLTIFFYDLIFQQVLSFRSLRPLVITLPMGFLSIFVLTAIKKRFF